jgi:hypothetical protein
MVVLGLAGAGSYENDATSKAGAANAKLGNINKKTAIMNTFNFDISIYFLRG